MLRVAWCSTCHGSRENGDELFSCSVCPKRFHRGCVPVLPTDKKTLESWRCSGCESEGLTKPKKSKGKVITEVRKAHRALSRAQAGFLKSERKRLLQFVDKPTLDKIIKAKLSKAALPETKPPMGEDITAASFSHMKATLRDYQVEGVRWIAKQYDQGVGGILGDEMGLGKTLQTIAFISHLKQRGASGPHLVVCPLAVLQNWVNELKRFAPDLTCCKVHGGQSERDRIMTRPEVLEGTFDVYLTTYETVISEEAFFCENFLWHTVTIDEGHRLKNETGQFSKSLDRVPAPFRLLLTGTPLQNNFTELWALLKYILPEVFKSQTAQCFFANEEVVVAEAEAKTKGSPKKKQKQKKKKPTGLALIAGSAKVMLQSLMLRRVKSDVEKSLLPKLEYTLSVPLTECQREWYARFLKMTNKGRDPDDEEDDDDEGEEAGLFSSAQLMARISQLQKVVNHPKQIVISYDRRRLEAKARAERARGAEFVTSTYDSDDDGLTEGARLAEASLRALKDPDALVKSSGKLGLLDRLIIDARTRESRLLIFSQYTQTLDVLEEYVEGRFGKSSYFRLDGSTNRITREMDMREFNAASGSKSFLYLISTRAGGQGINLATADLVVLYDSCSNPQVDLQAMDRAHRIGQTKQVKVYRLIAADTFEERVLARARQKLALAAHTLRNGGGGSLSLDSQLEDSMEEDTTLSLNEIWAMLAHGSEKIFDPTASKAGAQALTAGDYDAIIQGAAPKTIEDLLLNTDEEEPEKPAPLADSEENIEIVRNIMATPSPVAATNLQGTIFQQLQQKKQQDVVVVIDDDDDEMMDTNEQCSTVTTTPEVVVVIEDDDTPPPKKKKNKANDDVICDLCASPARDCECSEFAKRMNYIDRAKAEAIAGEFAFESRPSRKRKEPKRYSDHGPPEDDVNKPKKKPLQHESKCFACCGHLSSQKKKQKKRPKKKVSLTPEASTVDANGVVTIVDEDVVVVVVEEEPEPEPEEEEEEPEEEEEEGLLECGVCPKVYHLDCLGLESVPKGQWRCPWHSCDECERMTSNAGGVLFHCYYCPATYCFDCAPDGTCERPDEGARRYTEKLDKLHCPSLATYMFFKCTDCKVKMAPAKPTKPKRKRAKKVPKVPTAPVEVTTEVTTEITTEIAETAETTPLPETTTVDLDLSI